MQETTRQGMARALIGKSIAAKRWRRENPPANRAPSGSSGRTPSPRRAA